MLKYIYNDNERRLGSMFDLGEVIVYGFEGVFTVSEYTASPIDKSDKRVFYILTPALGASGNFIVAPSEGGSVLMRRVIDKATAVKIIDMVPYIEPVTVDRERNRRETYKSIASCGSCEGYVSILKTVKLRRAEFLAQKRRIAEADADYESIARKCLYSELSLVLEKPYAEIERLISEKL